MTGCVANRGAFRAFLLVVLGLIGSGCSWQYGLYDYASECDELADATPVFDHRIEGLWQGLVGFVEPSRKIVKIEPHQGWQRSQAFAETTALQDWCRLPGGLVVSPVDIWNLGTTLYAFQIVSVGGADFIDLLLVNDILHGTADRGLRFHLRYEFLDDTTVVAYAIDMEKWVQGFSAVADIPDPPPEGKMPAVRMPDPNDGGSAYFLITLQPQELRAFIERHGAKEIYTIPYAMLRRLEFRGRNEEYEDWRSRYPSIFPNRR